MHVRNDGPVDFERRAETINGRIGGDADIISATTVDVERKEALEMRVKAVKKRHHPIDWRDHLLHKSRRAANGGNR